LADARSSDHAFRLRIHQAIARQIGMAILSGDIAPGDSLPREIQHSAALGVSRTPYREAIRILVAKGLLETRQRAGTLVLPRERWNVLDPDILAWTFMSEPDAAFIHDLFELRGMLEPGAAGLAAKRRNTAQVEQMRAALADMRRHGLATELGQAADRLFHRLILEASGNAALASLSSSVGAAVQWTTVYKQQASEHPRDPMPEHEAVFEAIADGKQKRAADAMRELLRFALIDMGIAVGDT